MKDRLDKVAEAIKALTTRTPPEVVRHLEQELEKKRRLMPRGGSGEVFAARVGW